MTYREAAVRVLSENEAPMHYEEITRQALEKGYISPKGKTPQDTISTEISRDLRKNGENSIFIKCGKGIYGLQEFVQREQQCSQEPVSPKTEPCVKEYEQPSQPQFICEPHHYQSQHHRVL